MFYRNNITLPVSGYVSSEGVHLSRTHSGVDVAELVIVSIPEFYDTVRDNIVTGDTTYLPAIAWNQMALNIADRFKAGDNVLAVGDLKTQFYKVVSESDGSEREEARQVLSITDIGSSVRFSHLEGEGNAFIDHGENNGGGSSI